MSQYRVVSVYQAAIGGFEAMIGGPGIPAAGVTYWFDSENEPYSFVENLNILYTSAKEARKWRDSNVRKRLGASRRKTVTASPALRTHRVTV